jgi:hypothetical protein
MTFRNLHRAEFLNILSFSTLHNPKRKVGRACVFLTFKLMVAEEGLEPPTRGL